MREFKKIIIISSARTYESSVAADEVVHGLGQVQLAHGWKNTKCITGEKDDVLWMGTNAWDLSIGDVLYWICSTSVLYNDKNQDTKWIRIA